eukprot:TRINITY_DN66090_c0_g1_i1.p1 TRINITY_DN66090_c0_g1~~TRINITY_DN66090_c0_g1_i1.p1  ORF type:complete len:520 (+),score=110.84 TRINITY_DN66090_c0_g1_i1:82-1641(+)
MDDDLQRAEPQQLYQDALAFATCLAELCPRSAPPEKVNELVAELLKKAQIEDTTEEMRTKSMDLTHDISYLQIFATAWQKLQASGLGKEQLALELQSAGIDWRKQDESRSAMAADFRPGWASVRFREMLLGCGIGDTYGAGVEFWDSRWIHGNVDGTSFVLRRGDPVLHFYYGGKDLVPDGSGAGQNFLPGMYTDDCEMTVGLMHALMDADLAGQPTGEDMLRYWTDEYFKGQSHYLLTKFWGLAGIGRNGHGGIAFVFSGSQKIDAMRARIASMKYPGNAPPMRALPLAFLHDDVNLVKLALANADSTHPHVKARAASLGIAVLGRLFVIEKVTPSEVIPATSQELSRLDNLGVEAPGTMLDEETLQYLKDVDALPAPGTLTSSFEDFMTDDTLTGLCGPQPVWRGPDDSEPDGMPRMVRGLGADAQRTLGCVLYLLKHHSEGKPLETLLRSLYIGGDVDSLAALCLAMVGGREGLRIGQPNGLPTYMLQHLEAAEYLTGTADAFEEWVQNLHQKSTG